MSMVAQTKHFRPAGPRMQKSNSCVSKHSVGLKGNNNAGSVKLAISPHEINAIQDCGDDFSRTTTFNKRRSPVVERLHTARVSRPSNASAHVEREYESKTLRMISIVNSPRNNVGGRMKPSPSSLVEKEYKSKTPTVNGHKKFWTKIIPCMPETKTCPRGTLQNKVDSNENVLESCVTSQNEKKSDHMVDKINEANKTNENIEGTNETIKGTNETVEEWGGGCKVLYEIIWIKVKMMTMFLGEQVHQCVERSGKLSAQA